MVDVRGYSHGAGGSTYQFNGAVSIWHWFINIFAFIFHLRSLSLQALWLWAWSGSARLFTAETGPASPLSCPPSGSPRSSLLSSASSPSLSPAVCWWCHTGAARPPDTPDGSPSQGVGVRSSLILHPKYSSQQVMRIDVKCTSVSRQDPIHTISRRHWLSLFTRGILRMRKRKSSVVNIKCSVTERLEVSALDLLHLTSFFTLYKASEICCVGKH